MLDPDIKEPREPWRDPVVNENIIYSGQVLAMAGLYEVLFGDDRHSRPGGVSFSHRPLFWGERDGFTFDYDFTSLKNAILFQMVENGWLGVECEPNNIFIVCNQFPILGFRMHDARKGTSDAQLATFSYGKAWQEKGGFLNEFNLIMANYLVRQDLKTASQGLDFDAWTGSAINAWAPEMARAMFDNQAGKYFRQTPDGRVTIYPRTVLAEVAERRAQGDPNPDIKDLSFPVSSPSIGFAAAWMDCAT